MPTTVRPRSNTGLDPMDAETVEELLDQAHEQMFDATVEQMKQDIVGYLEDEYANTDPDSDSVVDHITTAFLAGYLIGQQRGIAGLK